MQSLGGESPNFNMKNIGTVLKVTVCAIGFKISNLLFFSTIIWRPLLCISNFYLYVQFMDMIVSQKTNSFGCFVLKNHNIYGMIKVVIRAN